MSLQAKSAIAAILLTSMAGSAMAQAPSEAKCIMQNFATLTLQDDGLAISATGSINNDKAEMLIASGAPYTLVTRAETVKLGLQAVQTNGKGKKAQEDNRVQLREFSIGAIEMGNQRILASQKLADNPGFGALIGADFLMQRDMELSLASHQLKFFNPVGCDKSFIALWDKDAAMVPLSTLSGTDRRPVVSVEVDGRLLRALIDTSAPMSIMNLSAAERMGVTPNSPGVTPIAAAAPGGRSTSWVAPFHKFSIGGEDVKNLKLPMLDFKDVVRTEAGTAMPDMILGEDFLRAHHVMFGSSQQTFYFSYVGGSVFNMDAAAKTQKPAATPTAK
jgi:predicted aspartyl protease